MEKSKEQIAQELTEYVYKRQKNDFQFEAVAKAIGQKQRPVGSAKDYVSSMGFKKAKENGWLEPYKDSLGCNFRRSETAWDENWAEFVKNSEFFNWE